MTGVVLGYIPSPSNGTFGVGPLTLHMYGVTLLLGIAACIWLTVNTPKDLRRAAEFLEAHPGWRPQRQLA